MPSPSESSSPRAQLLPPGWAGSRLLPSAAALKPATTSGTSFMISNRVDTDATWAHYINPLPGGQMNWFLSTAQSNDPTRSDYIQQGSSSTTPPDSFATAIAAALTSQTGPNPQLTVFIHGLGNLFSDAIWGMSSMGADLATFANYPGLVIGFDWPSYGEGESVLYYATNATDKQYYFPPTATSGSIRDNINGSTQAFTNLVAFLEGLRTTINGLTISLICHSEGNYMALLGTLGNSTQYFEHVLLLAADINNAALQVPSADPLVGQGYGIAQSGGDVTVYFTENDDVLPFSLAHWEYDYHNPEFGSRLGSAGPLYNAGQQPANLYSVDCSGVINVQNFQYLQSLKIIPTITDGSALSMHTSYLFIPQIVQDMAALLTGAGPANIANRVPTGNPRAYYMALNNNN